ncbi:hypothetical protein [Streptomyces xantholiticus]|uniref:LPXTG cell wall anchor domain-containing protein n=1 Tax=Streptomyces xantholiticus TaxID=68285 RepID=A0ABV1UUS5_9ACTN
MNRALRIPERWRLAGRVLAVVGIASAVTVTGLPGIETDTATAAPRAVAARVKPGAKRCDVKNLGKPYQSTPTNSGFPNDPTGSNFSAWQGNPKNFNYDLPGKAYDGVKPPTAADKTKALSKVSNDTEKNYKAWQKIADKSGNPEDRKFEIYARYFHNTEGLTFDHWFEHRFIRNQTNNHKGSAFERQLVRDFRLVGPDWLCEVTVELIDAQGNVVETRRYDAYNQKTKEFNEFKSNSELTNKQLAKDRKIARFMPDHKFRFTGAKPFTEGQRKKIDNLNRYVNRLRPGQTNQVRGNQRIYNPVPRTKPIRGYSDYQRWFAPGCQGGQGRLQLAAASSCGTRGPLNDRINGSGKTLEEAKKIQADARRLDPRGTLPRGGPGGVDFTTLELRYVGGLGKGKGMQYSMRADQMPNPDENPGFGGEARMQLSSDALFTWLALTPEKFWVNLNPDQPDKIMDAKFGRTDAGRVLLEADYLMKEDFAEALNPKKHAGGKRYWDTAPRQNGLPCFPGVRFWAEPKTAQVREQDGGIYILDAPLKVSAEWLDIEWEAPGSTECKGLTDAQKKSMEASVRVNIVPLMEERVNNDKRYADLRAVYTARVAAEYIRQQDAKAPTGFREIINSNDVAAWPLRAPHDKWTRDDVYQKYMKSLREGIEWFELEYGGKVFNQGVGGVDFSKQPKRNITQTRFNVEHRTLDTTTKTSLQSDDVSYRDTDTLYLGGSGNIEAGGEDPGPDPTPTPTDDPKPTDPPSTPAPDPSTPGDDGKPTPPANKPDPDGDLADTGSNTPVGLISGIAAAVVTAGAALVWWMRRRRQDATG